MSGHSHWSKVKHKKGAADAERGKIFSKISRLISVAARKGGDPEMNSQLRLAIEKAKEVNMPSDNIERAIKRGTGETGEGELQEIVFEAYGPGNIAMIIEGITDNRNRSLAEIKQILGQYNGKLVGEGSVRWLFEQKGVISVDIEEQTEELKDKETMELKSIDAGALDVFWRENILEIHTEPKDLHELEEKLEKEGIKVESSSLDWVPKEEVSVSDKDKESAEKLFTSLDENDSVQEIYSNISL